MIFLKNKVKLFKILLTILVIIITVIMLIYLYPVMKELSSIDGQIKFKERIDNSGLLGLFILFLIQFAQIFLIIVPGEPIEIAAGMCYGPIWGTIFIMISACITTIFIFFSVKKYGTKLVYELSDEKKIKKIEESKLFRDPKKIELIMLILFLIPGTPKDLLVYVAGLLPIKGSRFVIISTFARFPSVITSTLVGANLIKGQWKLGIILYISIFICVGLLIFIFNKFDKEKTAEKAIDIIK